MSDYFFTAKNKQTGEVIHVTALDDHFGHHRYGYQTGNRILTEEEFDLAYTTLDVTPVPVSEPSLQGKIVGIIEKPTPPTVEPWEGFESFDSFFAGLPMHKERDAMRLYEGYISEYIKEALEQERARVVEVVGKMLQTTPNPLKADIVHNKGERNGMYFNRGYNQAISDIINKL